MLNRLKYYLKLGKFCRNHKQCPVLTFTTTYPLKFPHDNGVVWGYGSDKMRVEDKQYLIDMLLNYASELQKDRVIIYVNKKD